MLPTTGGSLRQDFTFGELPSRTFRLRMRERAVDASLEIQYLRILDGGAPSTFEGRPVYDGGTPSTFTELEYFFDGGGPKGLLPEKRDWNTSDWDGVLTGFTDGYEAVKQAIFLILSTERYQYVIYSWHYGVELQALIGKPIPYVLPELKRRITEALTQDTRITGVTDFTFEVDRRNVTARFTVQTIFGGVSTERTVTI